MMSRWSRNCSKREVAQFAVTRVGLDERSLASPKDDLNDANEVIQDETSC